MDAEITKNRIPDIRARLADAIDEAVRQAAFDIQAAAQAHSPLDTGALRNSIHVVTSSSDGYAQAAAAAEAAHMESLAKGRTPKGRSVPKDLTLFPNMPRPQKGEAIVAVAVEYGAAVELGFGNRPPQPYLIPAAEANRERLARGVAAKIKQVTNV